MGRPPTGRLGDGPRGWLGEAVAQEQCQRRVEDLAAAAVLAVLVWHSYHVHLKHFNTSMFTGYMSRSMMEEEHISELDHKMLQSFAKVITAKISPNKSTKRTASPSMRLRSTFGTLRFIL